MGDVVGKGGVEFGEGRVDDPGVGLREEDGDPSAVVGELVVLAAGDAKVSPVLFGRILTSSVLAKRLVSEYFRGEGFNHRPFLPGIGRQTRFAAGLLQES